MYIKRKWNEISFHRFRTTLMIKTWNKKIHKKFNEKQTMKTKETKVFLLFFFVRNITFKEGFNLYFETKTLVFTMKSYENKFNKFLSQFFNNYSKITLKHRATLKV